MTTFLYPYTYLIISAIVGRIKLLHTLDQLFMYERE